MYAILSKKKVLKKHIVVHIYIRVTYPIHILKTCVITFTNSNTLSFSKKFLLRGSKF